MTNAYNYCKDFIDKCNLEEITPIMIQKQVTTNGLTSEMLQDQKELLQLRLREIPKYKKQLEKEEEEIKDLLKHFDFFIDLAKGHETNG